MLKYTEQDVINEIYELMNELGIKTFPTRSQIKNSNHSRLSGRIDRYGGNKYFINKYNITPWSDLTHNKYSDEYIINTLKNEQVNRQIIGIRKNAQNFLLFFISIYFLICNNYEIFF